MLEKYICITTKIFFFPFHALNGATHLNYQKNRHLHMFHDYIDPETQTVQVLEVLMCMLQFNVISSGFLLPYVP